jgi:hypothetical protein
MDLAHKALQGDRRLEVEHLDGDFAEQSLHRNAALSAFQPNLGPALHHLLEDDQCPEN